MSAPPASTDLANTYPNPSNATFKTAIVALLNYCTGLLGSAGTIVGALTALKFYGPKTFFNGSIAASVAANALTIALKDAAGNDPSASSPVLVAFRSATAATGTVTLRSVTSALSIVIPNTGTMGQSNGVAATLDVFLIDNAGTVELAAIKRASATIDESSVISTTALSTASDNADVYYSTSARTNVANRSIGQVVNTQATAGVWATAPSKITTVTV